MDVLALASVITAGVAAVSTAVTAVYSTRRTAMTAKEGRVEQRAAEGYLKVLSLAEQEAQWLEASVYNFGLSRFEVRVGIEKKRNVPEPAITDRAAAAALIAAFASREVVTSHGKWRAAGDALEAKLGIIVFHMTEHAEPDDDVPDEMMRELIEDLQPKERVARKVLAEAVARELGHR